MFWGQYSGFGIAIYARYLLFDELISESFRCHDDDLMEIGYRNGTKMDHKNGLLSQCTVTLFFLHPFNTVATHLAC